MAEKIEEFVDKLQKEGVQAGKDQAEKIKKDAEKQASQTIEQAEQQAEKIKKDAQAQADKILKKGKTDLQLAARDVVMNLRRTLGDLLEAVLCDKVRRTMSDEDFLEKLIRDLVGQYVKADLGDESPLQINLSSDVRKEFIERLMGELKKQASDGEGGIDVKAELSDAGLEYKVSGPTVEVTTDSVVQALCGLVSADMREMLEEVAHPSQDPNTPPGEQKEESPGK